MYDYDQPPDLKERLARHGFEIGEPEGIMVLEIAEAPEFLLQPVAADVRQFTDPSAVDIVTALETEIWGSMPPGLENFLQTMLQEAPDFLSLYIAYQAESPVAVGWAFYYPPRRLCQPVWRFHPGRTHAGRDSIRRW